MKHTKKILGTMLLTAAAVAVTSCVDDSKLLLTFDESGNCTIISNSQGVVASGSGKFVVKGEKKSWGNEDRDALYLDYTMDYDGIHCATKDTLVVHYRGVKAEWFTPLKK